MKKFIISFFLLLTFASATAQAQGRTFPMPEIPSELKTPKDRANYLVEHYWDNLEFKMISFFAEKMFLEQAFADFVSLFPIADTASVSKGVATLVERASRKNSTSTNLYAIAETAEKYLFETQSPLYNEEYFYLFTKYLSVAQSLSRGKKEVFAAYKRLLDLNAPETKANNFTFRTTKGKESDLYSVKAKKLLLILYDPECDHCMEIMKSLVENPDLKRLIKKKKVSVLAVFADGIEQSPGDFALNYVSDEIKKLVVSWTFAIDTTGVFENQLYWANNLPAIYLLDKTKTVRKRNFSPNQIAELF
ncbi:MAG: DUF5106 domain-containing protein [Bacteroidales bacterium]|nr:DUF5106 domain-containing protein [Bacteroidales bacterium]